MEKRKFKIGDYCRYLGRSIVVEESSNNYLKGGMIVGVVDDEKKDNSVIIKNLRHNLFCVSSKNLEFVYHIDEE